ncbi:FISUMP domain-containing protein [Flavihumibacter petaseus]|uniref:Fibrobacter succinogenes major paralogous domain-containing protein n=1 Tax=Flavihumibacter petaseus NBRC 106054 TaxID=1220578 RepID=A0A0E9N6B3_9BACT|nr:FISUMP domain-containing protein [Flavihumibacter petaseus]GAO44870.1 hypothetical protein FPE01S_04_01130 [Flavihumibacter petaseus NBRC 106054]
MFSPSPRRPALILAIICLLLSQQNVAQALPDTIRDTQGNTYLTRIYSSNLCWMTVNLATNIPGSYGYETSDKISDSFGRLYTWKSALEGCRLLGNGWHLPTNEEWQQLAQPYGGVRDVAADGGKAAYEALIDSGAAAFNAVYGGRYDPHDSTYHRVDAHGFYWTATATDPAQAWFYNLGRNGRIVNRHPDGQKTEALAVRCVKRIDRNH